VSLYLKWTAEGRVPSRQGGKPIPLNRWTARVTDPILCKAGWHACRWEDVSTHIAAELWVCELDGTIIEGDDKVVAERLKLVQRVPITDGQFRHFAADRAEGVLHLFELEHPTDDRPRKAIEAARAFADGLIGRPELAAAEAAAWAAAEAAQSDLLLNRIGLDPALFAHRGNP